jgi:hypothetical protein
MSEVPIHISPLFSSVSTLTKDVEPSLGKAGDVVGVFETNC